MADDTINPSQPLAISGKMKIVAEEQSVGGHFEGESERERKVGHDTLVVVDIFKRLVGLDAGTYYLRVSLRCPVNPQIITRYEIDMDKYDTEADFLKAVEWGGGAIAEAQVKNRGAKWDCEYVAKQARAAAVELLHEIDNWCNNNWNVPFCACPMLLGGCSNVRKYRNASFYERNMAIQH